MTLKLNRPMPLWRLKIVRAEAVGLYHHEIRGNRTDNCRAPWYAKHVGALKAPQGHDVVVFNTRYANATVRGRL